MDEEDVPRSNDKHEEGKGVDDKHEDFFLKSCDHIKEGSHEVID